MSAPKRIVAYSLTKRFAVTSEDHILPITNTFDDQGEETSEPEAVFSIVAGKDSEWFGWKHSDFEAADHN